MGYTTFQQRLYDAFMEMCRAGGRSPSGTTGDGSAENAENAEKAENAESAESADAADRPTASSEVLAMDGADIARPWLCTPTWDF